MRNSKDRVLDFKTSTNKRERERNREMRYRATASFSADGENEGHEVQGGEDGHYRYRDCHYSLTHSLTHSLFFLALGFFLLHKSIFAFAFWMVVCHGVAAVTCKITLFIFVFKCIIWAFLAVGLSEHHRFLRLSLPPIAGIHLSTNADQCFKFD